MAEITEEHVRKILEAELAKRHQTEKLPASWKLEALGYMGAIVVALATIASVGLSGWVASVVRDKTEQIIADKGEEGFLALKDEVVNTFNGSSEFRNNVAALVLPTDAVIVVDDEDGCPEGWEQHKDSKGRFIIGVGGQEGLFAKKLRQVGGSETHKLEIEEMPQHGHKYESFVVSRPGALNKIEEVTEQDVGTDRYRNSRADDWPWMNNTEVAGKGMPHNNMPPYIALYFCNRKVSD